MDLDPGEQLLFHGHPSWLSLLTLYVKGLAVALLAGVVAGLATRLAQGHVEVIWVVVAVIAVFAVLCGIGQLRRLQTTYVVTDRRLVIELGLLSRDLHQTRLARIQNVNAHQSLLHRLLGIGTINFDTAGEAGYDFRFVGVDDPRHLVRTVDGAMHEHYGLVPIDQIDPL